MNLMKLNDAEYSVTLVWEGGETFFGKTAWESSGVINAFRPRLIDFMDGRFFSSLFDAVGQSMVEKKWKDIFLKVVFKGFG